MLIHQILIKLQSVLPQEIKIYKRIDEILWEEWDPIGVNGYPEARDEYYCYLHEIAETKKTM
jgi:hypothetical protein